MNIEPCPKCGGEAGVFLRYDLPEIKWTVGCSKCGTEMILSVTSLDVAIRMWNKRIMLDLWRKMTPDDPGHHIALDTDGEQK